MSIGTNYSRARYSFRVMSQMVVSLGERFPTSYEACRTVSTSAKSGDHPNTYPGSIPLG